MRFCVEEKWNSGNVPHYAPWNFRRHVVSNARAVLAYMAVREMGHRGSELGDVLGISEPAVSKCVERGKIILDNKERLRYKLIN